MRLEDVYSEFTVQFTQTRPIFGLFSTIFINQPPTGGLAQEIDFRNLNLGLNATVDVNNLLGGFGDPPATSSNFVELTAKIVAHELGHLMGLRHRDAFGPIGSGIGFQPGRAAYTPPYPGPVAANETNRHIMGSPAATGESLQDAISGQYFGARSAVKLAFFSFQGQVLGEQFGTHDTPLTSQPITLSNLVVPNTEMTGSLVGLEFDVEATVVTGAVQGAGEVDVYSFDATAGQVLNMELMSSVLASSPLPRFTQAFDTMISVVDASGTAIPYYAGTAINDNEFESTDSILIDLIIPADGTYYIQVESSTGLEVGQYELFVYNFEANTPAAAPGGGTLIPPTASVTLIGGAGPDSLSGTDNNDLLIGNGDADKYHGSPAEMTPSMRAAVRTPSMVAMETTGCLARAVVTRLPAAKEMTSSTAGQAPTSFTETTSPEHYLATTRLPAQPELTLSLQAWATTSSTAAMTTTRSLAKTVRTRSSARAATMSLMVE